MKPRNLNSITALAIIIVILLILFTALTISATLNDYSLIAKPIPDQTIAVNNSLELNLSEYFQSEHRLWFSCSKTENIFVLFGNSLAEPGELYRDSSVTLFPLSGWTGEEVIEFKATDGRTVVENSVLVRVINITAVTTTTIPKIKEPQRMEESKIKLALSSDRSGVTSLYLPSRVKLGVPQKIVEINKTRPGFDPGMITNETLSAELLEGENPKGMILQTKILSVTVKDPVASAIRKAIVRLPKTGKVEKIAKCSNYTDRCNSGWEVLDIDFDDYGSYIEFRVKEFSAYAGVQLDILNVQSYPTVGGNWTVMFETTGEANLTIIAVDGTTFAEVPDNSSTVNDLQFLELRRGNTTLTDFYYIVEI